MRPVTGKSIRHTRCRRKKSKRERRNNEEVGTLFTFVLIGGSRARSVSQIFYSRGRSRTYRPRSIFRCSGKSLNPRSPAGDKAMVSEMTNFPLSMPYLVKAVKNKEDFLRRYNEIFNGESNAAQCFASAEPRKESARRYEIYCPFKDTPRTGKTHPFASFLN